MGRLVFVEAGCLVDTWTMATRLVRSVGRRGVPDAVAVLEAEAARGTDPAAVHRALWALLGGCVYGSLAEPSSGATVSCVDRDDALGRAARRALSWHRRVGDRIVVVCDLMPMFVRPLMERLAVDRVLCGRPPVDAAGRLDFGYPDILLGAAAARAAEQAARHESVELADCVAYGRDHRDRELLDVVGHAVRIGYDGELRSLPSGRVLSSADDGRAHTGAGERLTARSPAPPPATRPTPRSAGGRRRPA